MATVLRSRETAIRRDPKAHLVLNNMKAIRAASAACRLNPVFAHAIDTLEIRLNSHDLIVAIAEVDTIFRHAVRVGVLVFFVDRLPRAYQSRLLDAVFFPNLWCLKICSSSQQGIRRFLHHHRRTLRHLYFEESRRHTTMEAWNGLPLLELDSIVGPIQCVAEALPHCANRELTISITGETNASSLQIYGPVFQSFSVATLLVRLRPCDYGVVQSLVTFFPFVSRLEIFEKHVKSPHVWHDSRAWAATLRGFAGLSRLVLHIPQFISVGRIRVRAWFPTIGTSLRDIEFRNADGFLGAWARDYGSNRWYVVCPAR